jgi:aspartate/methionine/tyrosine aminotransferase
MTSFAAAKMAAIKESGIRRILVKAWELASEGREIIDFSIGRPDFDTPRPIRAAAAEAMNAGRVHYTHSLGLIELRRALAEDVHRRLGLTCDPQTEILVTIGSTAAIMITLLTVLEPGDEVLVPEPMYLFYLDWAEYANARTVPLPMDPDHPGRIDESALRAKVTDRTKVILINSPHNPTGSGLGRAGLEAVARVAVDRDLLVVSDEVYDRIVFPPFEHHSLAELPGLRERTVVVNSFSKSFAMDGWRIGYLTGPADLVGEIEKTQQHTVLSAATFVQWAAVEALRRGDELVGPMLEAYAARRRLMLDLVESSSRLSARPPQGAFYVWAKIDPPAADDWTLVDRALDEAGVAVTPGEVFGPSGAGYLRLSFCLAEDKIEKGMTRLKRVLETMD